MALSEIVTIDRLAGRLQNATEGMIFAGVVALTRTAKHGQRAVQDNLPDVFNIRNKWTIQGIRITPATKQKQEAEVYSKDWYMPIHETGGKRDPKPAFWIPVGIREALGLSSLKQPIPQWARPRNLIKGRRKIPLTNTKAFYQTINETVGLWARIGNDKNSIRLLYAYTTEPINIPRREWFYKPVVEAYDKYLEVEYNQALLEEWAK